jgi:hypothetical protein
MSYSMREPESEPVCECCYDPLHDRMDRDNCFFHCDMGEDGFAPLESLPSEVTIPQQPPYEYPAPPKKPPTSANPSKENAA